MDEDSYCPRYNFLRKDKDAKTANEDGSELPKHVWLPY